MPAPQPGEEALLLAIADAVEARLSQSDPRGWGEVVATGADGTPTKAVDRLAEEEVLRVVEASDVPLNILSEEAGFVDHGAKRTLVVDPVDGTTNAGRGIPAYCVGLAVGTSTLADVDLAIVRNLVNGATYRAASGEGATLDGAPLHVRALGEGRTICSIKVPGLDPERLGRMLRILGHPDHRYLGTTTLEMCLVAQGALDLLLVPRPILRIVDVAASALVVREAGGLVLDPAGEPLDMPFSLEPRVGLAVAGDPKALEVLEVLA